MLGAPLAVAAALDVDRAGARLFGVEGPSCPLGAALGEHACPGCGLTRGTALAVQGQWVEAAAVHPAGILVALLCAGGLLIHLDALRRGAPTARHRGILRAGYWAFVAGIGATWLMRASGMWSAGVA